MRTGTALLLLSLCCFLDPLPAASPSEEAQRPMSGEVAAAKGNDEKDLFSKRWIVRGRALDEKGKGIEGAVVKANCGCGTLMPTGKTLTGKDGSYTLRFGPGMGMVNEKTGKEEVGLQAASIFALKDGFFEKNLNRQGDLYMAGTKPRKKVLRDAGPVRVLLPGKPVRLDFVLKPAAVLKGTVLDEAGLPVGGQPIWISGDELPPSSSVLAQARTDRDGLFYFRDVPTGYAWHLVMSHPRAGKDETTAAFRLAKACSHEVSLICRRPHSSDPKSLLILSSGPKPVPEEERRGKK